MNFALPLVAAVALLGSTSAVFAQSACMDDPRLARIADLIADQPNTPEPLMVSPETFFNLTPAVREALGDNIEIWNAQCEAVQIHGGLPATKVGLPFGMIYNGLFDAIIRKDEVAVERTIRGFEPLPITTLAAVGMSAQVSAPEPILRQISERLGIAPITTSALRDNCEPENKEFFALTMLDIFARLGGRIEDGPGPAVLMLPSSGDPAIVPQAVEIRVPKIVLPTKTCSNSYDRLVENITSAGGFAIKTGFAHSSQKKTVQDWIEAYKADRETAPPVASLFD